MQLPDPERGLIPKGHYTVKVSREPELHRTSNEQKVYPRFFFKLQGINNRSYDHVENFFPWMDNYTDLAIALGAPQDDEGNVRMSQIEEFIGKTFEADINHEPDRNDPDKIWARLSKLQPIGNQDVITQEEDDIPPPSDDDVPPPENDDDPVPF